MKSIGSLLSFILCSSISCFGQVYVDGIAIDTVNTSFCQLICANGDVLTKTSVIIDYGQRYASTGFNRQKIAGPDKQPIKFNSPVDVLNFMAKQGWDLVSSQTISNASGGENKFVYLLRRKRKDNER